MPQIGRVMEFQFVDRPETNVLFVNPAMLGKAASAAGAGNWANFGGDKLWPSPQSEWPLYVGSTWPPDPAFDGTPENANVVRDGVRMVTGDSTTFGLQATRTFTMQPGSARLYVNQVLRRTAAPRWGAKTQQPVPDDKEAVGIWSVTQVRPDAAFFFPVNPQSAFPQGFATFGGDGAPNRTGSVLPSTVTQSRRMIVVRHDPEGSFKIAVDSRAGYAAAIYGAGILFSEHYQPVPAATYPDGGSTLEAYSSAKPGYEELETLGPLNDIALGSETRYPIYWELHRLRSREIGDPVTAIVSEESKSSNLKRARWGHQGKGRCESQMPEKPREALAFL